ncbi:uncharacterized protein LOC107271331 [Cephus cinctus]|uniref:Uncharacterized protein LOC107271331 n=1 Tax=Cephus cinctus TaxID=211228 RepID=A0AAJ7C6L4_CEPCN|nr:uncharacterized protein LOC107271331 [Cephus cinctus]
MSSQPSTISITSVSVVPAQECVPEWDQNSTTILIEMYKERKCLWDPTHEFYKNRRLRREALTDMANHFNCSLADVEKKLYMLRSSFRKEYRRWNSAKLSAGPNNTSLVRKPQWFALDLLMFLKDDVTKKPLTSVNQNDNFDGVQHEFDISTTEIQNVFYYDSENSTLTSLEPGEITLDYNLQQIQAPEATQQSPGSLKRSVSSEPNLLELTNKRQKTRDAEDTKLHVVKSFTGSDSQEKDANTAFGNFVAEELKNIKDNNQVQVAKLRIHQVLYDATCSFLKVPIPRT